VGGKALAAPPLSVPRRSGRGGGRLFQTTKHRTKSTFPVRRGPGRVEFSCLPGRPGDGPDAVVFVHVRFLATRNHSGDPIGGTQGNGASRSRGCPDCVLVCWRALFLFFFNVCLVPVGGNRRNSWPRGHGAFARRRFGDQRLFTCFEKSIPFFFTLPSSEKAWTEGLSTV